MTKRSFAFFLPAFVAMICCGCGGSSSMSGTGTPASNYPRITGNWSLIGNSQVMSGGWLAGGSLTNINGSASGIIHILDSSCFQLTQDIPFTGTITTAGVVSFKSTPVSSQVVTMTGTIITGGSEGLLAGSYSVAGGCATLIGTTVPPLTNTYSGTIVTSSKISVPISLTIAQSGPNNDGFYQITGSMTSRDRRAFQPLRFRRVRLPGTTSRPCSPRIRAALWNSLEALAVRLGAQYSESTG
jgi:hypothetical protein